MQNSGENGYLWISQDMKGVIDHMPRGDNLTRDMRAKGGRNSHKGKSHKSSKGRKTSMKSASWLGM